MSCPRSTASMESAAICLRALGWPWVAACQAREDAAVALRSPFQPITCLWQFEGLSGCWPPSMSYVAPVSACVAHDVNGQRLDVSRSDDAPDGQRRAQLVAPLVEIVAED